MKKVKHICGFCKYYDSDLCYCQARGEHEIYEEDFCDNWEGEEPDFDLEYHDKKCEGQIK